MANKKQQKRKQELRRSGSAGGQQEASEPAGPDPSTPAEAPSPGPARSGGGANVERREQKEAVRREKEKQLRRIQRTDTAKKVGIVVIILAVLGGGAWYIQNQGAGRRTEIAALLEQYPEAKVAAGCTDVSVVPPYDPEEQDASHTSPNPPENSGLIAEPPLDTYQTIPPVSGPHDAVPETAGIKDVPPSLRATIHSLEHGGAIIWYRPGSQSGAEFQKIEDFVSRYTDHMMLAPYDYPDEGEQGQLPQGVNMSLVAWHHEQNCQELSLPVIAKFMSEYRYPALDGDYKGDAPETGAQM